MLQQINVQSEKKACALTTNLKEVGHVTAIQPQKVRLL